MSDDRMNRAERIRNMREGNRGTDDDHHEDEPAATDEADESADETTDGDGQADGVSSTEETVRSDPADTASTADSGPSKSSPADETETPTASDLDAAADAQAAAQRAAASAAEVMGADTDVGASEASAKADDGEGQGTAAADGSDVPAGATGARTVPGDITGVELPDRDLLEAAMAESDIETTEGGARAAMGEESAQSEELVRVLEFSLGGEYYCLDIEYVEEIVKRDTVTRVPNTPAFVDGVVDLRGQITTILEPKEMMDIDGEGEQNLMIVFDPEQFEEQGAIGWVVDEVRQVVPVTESEVNHPPVDAEYINGVVDREEYEQFVIWIEPEDALAQATAADGT